MTVLRPVALALALVAITASCSGRQEIFAPDRTTGERGVTLPDPVPASPVFAIRSSTPLSDARLKEAARTKGVAVIAPVAVRKMKVRGEIAATLRVGAVEPLVFRSIAPPSTREAEFVWVSLILGQAVPTFDAARRLGLAGASEIAVGGTAYDVGAFADNGTPNVADVIVNDTEAGNMKLGAARTAIVGARSGVTVEALRDDLKKLFPKADLVRLIPEGTVPVTQQAQQAPTPVGHVQGGVIGSMRFEILPNGFIRPDPAWVSANIVRAEVPIIGSVTCHRLLIPRLQGALEEVVENGLAGKIRPSDYGGCYVPRFIDRDVTRSLSNHAFGLAVDINVSTNQLGTRGDLDPRIVAIFKRWGFEWGGDWSRPDPMHFEL